MNGRIHRRSWDQEGKSSRKSAALLARVLWGKKRGAAVKGFTCRKDPLEVNRLNHLWVEAGPSHEPSSAPTLQRFARIYARGGVIFSLIRSLPEHVPPTRGFITTDPHKQLPSPSTIGVRCQRHATNKVLVTPSELRLLMPGRWD